MFSQPFLPFGATKIAYLALLLALTVACSMAWKRRRAAMFSLLGVAALLLLLDNLATLAMARMLEPEALVLGPLGLAVSGVAIGACGLGIAGAILLARQLGGPGDAPREQPAEPPLEGPDRSASGAS